MVPNRAYIECVVKADNFNGRSLEFFNQSFSTKNKKVQNVVQYVLCLREFDRICEIVV